MTKPSEQGVIELTTTNPRSAQSISGLRKAQLSPLAVVRLPVVEENPVLRKYLIERTERLDWGAKNGKLRGLGGFTDWGDSYTFGLEGSFLERPEDALLMIERLKYRIMKQIESQDR